MNLFDSIGLKTDPFSTSPNVDLFYPAVQHRQCLEGLELAVRMRRGLSVIRGGIGVGKTTISRKLIQNFKSESDDFDFYLILDPKFESELILLKYIIKLFGVANTGESVQECRNIIENYLLKVGVEQGKTLVLIVDEGQNLPGEMLDVFRTLLNFETDDFKLLQLIIFGQPEMGTMIHKYPNFEDRISFDFEIGPIGLEDMKGMIDHRIEISGGKAGSWFTEDAILKIHKNTQGYPRKVTQLCHQLLLTMMSENKTEISDEMVQRVISGKVNTVGLLQQKKKNYSEIAVNKLLDVLRKDQSKEDTTEPEPVEIEKLEDDWIGGGEPPSEPTVPKEETKPVSNPEPAATTEQKPEDIIFTKAPVDKPEPEIALDPAEDVLPRPGKYPPHIPPKKIPLDNSTLGVSVDSGRITSVLIDENKGIKTLLTYNIHASKARNLDPAKNPSEFSTACTDALTDLEDGFVDRMDLYKSATKSIKDKNTISLNINDDRMLMRLVEVPKENKKDKKQIIEWAIRKGLAFPAEDAIYDHAPGYNDHVNVGIGDKSALVGTSSLLNELGWEIRWWNPTAQSVFNAFSWNYPEHRQKTTLILHFGENMSLILGCIRGTVRVVESLHIGLQSLTDALRDQGQSTENWYERDEFQVPESFIRAFGKTAKTGEHDDIFRSVFDSWRQEIDRTINSIRKDFTISEDTEVLLSGSAGDIKYLDQFIEGSLGLHTQFLNPVRNLAFSPSEDERSNLPFHPTLLTAAIGSALTLPGTVNVLPLSLKQNEIFRWANRISVPVAAALLVILFGITGTTKADFNSINSEIIPLQEETSDLSYVQQEHTLLTRNKNNVNDQLDILSYDTEYFRRVLAITRFLSYNTPKEITMERVSYQQGWEVKKYKKMGRDLVQLVEMEDEDKRTLRLLGDVKANPALKDRYFNNFITDLENSGLFQSVEIVFQNSQASIGTDHLQFEVKCII